MACYHPLKGYRAKTLNSSGKRNIVFNKSEAFTDMSVELPCGQCIGCRLERSRQWAIRCVHEAQCYESNAFITLTYQDNKLPKHNSLKKSHFQKFMKRLRFQFAPRSIRFFHCGEYGEQNHRPHYHALLFNFDFPDRVFYKEHNGQKYYVSKILGTELDADGTPVCTGEGLWQDGISVIGDVTFESAAYVARYITKKITGPLASLAYEQIDTTTGEVTAERLPEYVTMSRRPGIGKPWFDKYKTDLFPHDVVVMRGKKLKMPRFYNAQHEKENPRHYAKLKAERQVNAEQHKENNTPDRLKVREEIQFEKFKQLKRSLENGQT